VLASCFFIFRFNVSERIALHFEFPEMEKQITRYAETRAYDSRIEEYGEYIGLMWYPGILDNYNMIVYDKTDTLDLMVKMEQDFPDNQQIQKFKESFRNYHIRRIYKIKDNYYRCFITFG
ncbi:MAG: hypothetical protein MJ162_00460, partial [Treponema sp.]|nr:hypothetical protein [Treponema sp.]